MRNVRPINIDAIDLKKKREKKIDKYTHISEANIDKYSDSSVAELVDLVPDD